jgi:hypothetical protein
MMDDLEELQGRMEKGIKTVFPGVKRVIVSAGSRCQPTDTSLAGIIEKMRELKAGEVLLDSGDDTLLIVKYDYGDSYVTVQYQDEASPVDMSRLIQLMFSRQKNLRDFDVSFMPSSAVESQIKIWEDKISLVFGRRFAKKITKGAFFEGNKGKVTPADLESIRVSISSKLGDCLLLDKVHK